MLEQRLKNGNKEEIYQELIPLCESLLKEEKEWISILSNFVALIKQSFESFSWVGFYLLKDNNLILGPFQGNVACSFIDMGKGVCGTSAVRKETIIVEDVNKFPGHIACDENSKSEIVLPIILNDKLIGVLDIDSYNFSNFDEIDKDYLEKLIYILVKKLQQINFNGI